MRPFTGCLRVKICMYQHPVSAYQNSKKKMFKYDRVKCIERNKNMTDPNDLVIWKKRVGDVLSKTFFKEPHPSCITT